VTHPEKAIGPFREARVTRSEGYSDETLTLVYDVARDAVRATLRRFPTAPTATWTTADGLTNYWATYDRRAVEQLAKTCALFWAEMALRGADATE
jgi:hypothetical protein